MSIFTNIANYFRDPTTVGGIAKNTVTGLGEATAKVREEIRSFVPSWLQAQSREDIATEIFNRDIIANRPANYNPITDATIGPAKSTSKPFNIFEALSATQKREVADKQGQEIVLGFVGGPEGNLAKQVDKIAAEKSAPKISEILTSAKKLFGLADKDIPALSEKLAKVTKPEEVNILINSVAGKERKFVTSLKGSPKVAEGVKQELVGPETRYTPLPNQTIIGNSKAAIANNPEEVAANIFKTSEPSAQTVSDGIHLIEHYQGKGEYEKASDVAMDVAEKLTRAGQTVQAAKIVQRMSPESVLIQANKIIEKVNKTAKTPVKLPPETSKRLSDLAKKMKEATDQGVKDEFSDEINAVLNGLKTSDAFRKISTFQTIAQLLNPKTIVRNIIGNELFYRLERVNKLVSSPIDWARSTLTGSKRTVTFYKGNQGGYWDGFLRGAKSGWNQTSPYGLTGQFDAYGYTPAFKGKWNPLTYLEKALRATLQGFDVAAFTRAKNNTISELGWLQAKNEGLSGKALKERAIQYSQAADDNILQIATDYGKYVTFQDDNFLSRMLSGIKDKLNLGKGFGVGDLTIKYPKTPGALIMRGLDYSPAGFLRSAYLLAKPFFTGEARDPRVVTEVLSRAITGTIGLTGLGYFLADKGIITAKPEKDYDIQNLQQQSGIGQYQVNISALRRWVFSGFDSAETKIQKDDWLYSYDWAQPIAMSISLGANANRNVKESGANILAKGFYANVPGTVESSITGAFTTITEQPVLKGLSTLFSNTSDPVDAVREIIKSTPSSFTPTFLNQIRQYNNNVSRETVTNSSLGTAINRVKNRIPGLDSTLPVQYDTMGKPKDIYQKPSILNIFLNPGFISQYKPSPGAEMVLDIYNNTGETKEFPRSVPKSLTFYGQKFVLNNKQRSVFQKKIGEKTSVIFNELGASDSFRAANDTDKIKLLNAVLTSIYDTTQLSVLTNEQLMALLKGLKDDTQRENLVKRLQGTSF